MGEPPIPPTAPPNGLAPDELRVRPGADGTLAIDPERAGWRYLSFRSLRLAAGETHELGRAGHETALVVLAGGGAVVEPEKAQAIELAGRTSVWDGLPWAAYLPVDRRARVTGRPFEGHEAVLLAIAEAPRSGRPGVAREPIRITPDDVAVEVRGAGNATRQISHIVTPETPADRLLIVEVYTPSGNWSSWPPHKHDEDAMPGEAVLEEIYYYQFRRPEAWAIQRLYRRPGTPAEIAAGPRDGLWAVRHGELVLVTDGYHPFAAAHGDDAYYLNALAGDRRTMACSFDPDLDFVRAEWTTMSVDSRVPLVSQPKGRRR